MARLPLLQRLLRQRAAPDDPAANGTVHAAAPLGAACIETAGARFARRVDAHVGVLAASPLGEATFRAAALLLATQIDAASALLERFIAALIDVCAAQGLRALCRDS